MRHHNNFDFLRVLFSFLVMIGHSMILSGSQDFRIEFFAAMPNYSVFAFFVISGFLIYASLDKLRDSRKYFINRAKRILPAYVSVVVFFAFFLYFLSGADISEYFSATWLRYLSVNLIFLNFLQPCIPYVFTENYICAVNGSLWTIKVEIMFYLFIPLLFFLMRKMNLVKKNLVLILIYILSIIYFSTLSSLGKYELAKQLPGCLSYFVSGIILYLNLEFLKKHSWFFVIPSVAVIILEKMVFHTTILFPFAMASVIIAFAYSKIPLQNFAKFGDISYGMYLIHFPVIQIFVAKGWYNDFGFPVVVLSYAVVIAASFLCWHFVEKPFLKKKFTHKPV